MCYSNQKELFILPKNVPDILRHCSKCGNKEQFQNSGKFRLNANKGNLDVWSIYKCRKCQTTWNMTIYERIPVNQISVEELQKFQNNNPQLAMAYGLNPLILNKNKAEVLWNSIEYSLTIKDLPGLESLGLINDKIKIFSINYPFELNLRIDKFLADFLDISRSELKTIVSNEKLICLQKQPFLKSKLKNGLIFHLKQ